MSSTGQSARARTALWVAVGAIVVGALGYIPILYVSLILGIVAGVAALIALVMGVIAVVRGGARGIAIAAIVLGAVGLAVAAGATAWGATLIGLSQG